MKKSDLYREWGRVLDMCDGTNVDPVTCWKYAGINVKEYPKLDGIDLHKYEFAVAILENKPVFVGDKVYHKNGFLVTVVNNCFVSDVFFSWHPQEKKTFALNGVELPRPSSEDGYMFLLSSTDQKKKYYFDSLKDRNTFADAVINIIEDALK